MSSGQPSDSEPGKEFNGKEYASASDSPDSDSSESSGQLSDGELSEENPLPPNAAQLMVEWHKLQGAIDLDRAINEVDALLESHDPGYTAAKFNVLASQLAKAILRPSTFHEMPKDYSDVDSHLHSNKQYINQQIDLHPDLLELLLEPGAWEELLTTCLSSPEKEADVRTDDSLPIIKFPNEERSDGTQPNDNVFFFRAGGQVFMVFAGRLDYQWFNVHELTTGEVSRLRLLVSRFQPKVRGPWVELVPGSLIQLRNVARDDGVVDQGSDIPPQVHDQGSDKHEPQVVSQSLVLDMKCRYLETDEYRPRDSQHPAKTYWRDRNDVEGTLWRPHRGPQQPGFFYTPSVRALVFATVDPLTVQSLERWCKVVKGEVEVEIVSEMVNMNGVAADFGTCFMESLNVLNSNYDPQSVCSQVYKEMYRILEHVLYNANRRLQYREAFDENWVTVSKGRTRNESRAVFLFPYPGPGRSQMVAKAYIVSTENGLVRMFVSFTEVGDCGPFHSNPTPADILRLEILGAHGVTMLRKCIESVSSGASKEETMNTRLNISTKRVVEVDPKRKHVWPDKTDEGDVRNFNRIIELLIPAGTLQPFFVRISQQPTAERLSSLQSYYVVAQSVEFMARLPGVTSELFIAIQRVWTERRRRPHWPQGRLGPMKPDDVELKIKVSTGDDASWPLKGQHNFFGLPSIATNYMMQNNLYLGKCKPLLTMFTFGGNVLLSCTEGSHWERYYYLEIWDKLDIHVLDLVRFLSLIMGSSAFDCAMQRTNEPKRVIWIGTVKGEGSVPDKRIRISMFPEKHRHSGCGNGEELKLPLLTLEIQVDLDDMALAPVCFILRIFFPTHPSSESEKSLLWPREQEAEAASEQHGLASGKSKTATPQMLVF